MTRYKKVCSLFIFVAILIFENSVMAYEIDIFGGVKKYSFPNRNTNAYYTGQITNIGANYIVDSSANIPVNALAGKVINPNISRKLSPVAGIPQYNNKYFKIISNTSTRINTEPNDGNLNEAMGGILRAAVGDIYEICGFFTIEKINNRWTMVTPAGNPYFPLGYSVVNYNPANGKDSAGRGYYDYVLMKYPGDSSTAKLINWASSQCDRLMRWGFNIIGPFSAPLVGGLSYYSNGPIYPRMPTTVTLRFADYSLRDVGDYLGSDVKNVLNELQPIWKVYPGRAFPDVFDPAFEKYADYHVKNSGNQVNGGLVALRNSPWVAYIDMDNADELFGFGRLTYHPHLGWASAATPPEQIQALIRGTMHIYSDKKVYTKHALKEWLYDKYKPIGAPNYSIASDYYKKEALNKLNIAWGSKYTSWESNGGWGTGTGFLDESGKGSWLSTDWINMKGANPNCKSDCDLWIVELSKRYHKVCYEAIKRYLPNHLVQSPEYFGWNVGSRPEVIKGAKDYIDLFVVSAEGPWNVVADIGKKPMVAFTWFTAEPDSSLYKTYPSGISGITAGLAYNTQRERAIAYSQMLEKIAKTKSADGVYYMLGLLNWSYMDASETFWNVGDRRNFGVVTLKDNAYDGIEATRLGADRSSGTWDDEERDYGDFLTLATQANKNIYDWAFAGIIGSTETPPDSGGTVVHPPPPTITPTPSPSPTPTSPPSHTAGNKKGCSQNKQGSLRIFFGLAYVNADGSPIGNLKSYEVSTTANESNSSNTANTANISTGVQVVDSTKTPALDSENQIKSSSRSFWSSDIDGKKVDKGGVGEVLLSRTKPRNIFTNLGDSNLTLDSNSFDTSNETLTPELLGLAPKDMAGREKLIQYVRGYDSYVNVKDESELKKRKWIFGTIINSRPLVIPYEGLRSVIFVGANDGMLHAFDNATGEEIWGFIPNELLSRLKDLTNGNSLKYYVDGSPKAYVTDSQKIIIFGLGKGGNHYYALDVTSPDNPKLLWKIGPGTTGFSELGQTWSTPQIGKVKYETGEKMVAFIGGGYDENQSRGVVSDKKGRAVYAIDVMTGTQIWRWDHGKDGNMNFSIPSDISCVDTNGDGYIDRLYVGDTGERMWRFDINGSDPNAWSGSLLFNSSAGLIGGWRKIFSRPDVTLERGYEMVFFGTGDREHPDEKKVINQIYAIKDRGLNSTLSESNLDNMTEGINSLKSIEGKEGWFIGLENKGEKALAPTVVLFGVAYFTTFTPSKEGSTEGVARLYALNYKNGGPILDLNPANNTEGVKIDLSDRSKVIGTGIPSGVVISTINGKPIAYTGFQGGVYNTPLRKNTTIIPIWWKEVRK